VKDPFFLFLIYRDAPVFSPIPVLVDKSFQFLLIVNNKNVDEINHYTVELNFKG
jgi:hypothetical protein